MMIDMGLTQNKMFGARVFQYLFERLGDLQYRYWEWPKPIAKAPADPKMSAADKKAKLRRGFEYIEQNCPKANIRNAFTIWAETETVDDDSPVYGWHVGLVQESLGNYAKSNCLQMKKDLRLNKQLTPPEHVARCYR